MESDILPIPVFTIIGRSMLGDVRVTCQPLGSENTTVREIRLSSRIAFQVIGSRKFGIGCGSHRVLKVDIKTVHYCVTTKRLCPFAKD